MQVSPSQSHRNEDAGFFGRLVESGIGFTIDFELSPGLM
jgi:hypothetical protein